MRPTHPSYPPQPMPPAPGYVPQPGRPGPPAAPIWREAAIPAQAAMQLLCPKCQGLLVTYERQGVHLEQCRECRGIWLDRGELDRLLDAEAAVSEPSVQQAPSHQAAVPERWDDDDHDRRERDREDDDDEDRGRRRRGDDDRRGRPGRRRSMFGELFEGLLE
jgi:uncharacterized protein